VRRDAASPLETWWLGTEGAATEQTFQACRSSDGLGSSAGHGADTGAGQGVLVRWSAWVDAFYPGRLLRAVLS